MIPTRRIVLSSVGVLCIVACASTAPYGDIRDDEPTCEDEISFPDGNLEERIRQEIGGQERYTGCMDIALLQSVTTLSAYGAGIGNLSGTEYLTQLETLILATNNVENLRPLVTLFQLEYLDVANNPVKNLEPVGWLTNLRVLNLCTVGADDFSDLGRLTQLRRLNICQSGITDVSFLGNATRMRALFLGYNRLEDLTALAAMPEIEELHLNDNNIRDISPLSSLSNLVHLNLAANPVCDITSLLDIAGQRENQQMDLSGTAIDCDDLTTLSVLSTIDARGVRLIHDCEEEIAQVFGHTRGYRSSGITP